MPREVSTTAGDAAAARTTADVDPLDPTAVDAYLARIGAAGPLRPDLDTLRRLHAGHLRAVPFENSSVLHGEPIVLDPAALVHKVAVAGRGGFCYELNGAFGTLLRTIGFAVDNLSGRVYGDGGELGPPFDHLSLRVWVDGAAWLADVGFGYCFRYPLRLEVGTVQPDPAGRFRLDRAEDGDLDLSWDPGDGRFRPQYRMDLEHHDLAEYRPMCVYQATSPDSPFTGGWVCSVATDDGGVTLSGPRLFTYRAGKREERRVTGSDDERAVLQRWFRVDPTGFAG